MALSLSLPTIQNWSCHGCSACCRQHQIILTDADRQRILQQNWTQADGVPAGAKAIERAGRGRGAQYRLAHRADGACVFLDENNRCRIHARFGEAAKPLACRVYPFAFHPAGQSIAVSLRFACPSVAANQGEPVTQQRRELATLRDLVVPDSAQSWPAPPIWGTQQLDWPDTLRIIRRLTDFVCQEQEDSVPLALRLVQALFVAGMLGRATFEKVRGGRIDELMETLLSAAPLETAASIEQIPEPPGLAKAQFRLITAQYAAHDTLTAGGLGYRLKKMLAGLRFARGRGQTPIMQPGLKPVPFADLEHPRGASSEPIDQLLRRYYHVRLNGMAFCGPGCYGLSVVEGFQGLVLLYPVILYLARWIALSQQHTALTPGDVEGAVRIVDHQHGYCPAMAQRSFRQRARWLAGQDQIARLLAWYSR